MNSDKLLAVAIDSAKKAGVEVAKHYKSGENLSAELVSTPSSPSFQSQTS